MTETSLIKNPQEPYCRWVFLLEPDDCTALQSGKHSQEQVWTMSKSLSLAARCKDIGTVFSSHRFLHNLENPKTGTASGNLKTFASWLVQQRPCADAPENGYVIKYLKCISDWTIVSHWTLCKTINEGVVLSEWVNSCKVKNCIADHSWIISKCALQSVLGPVWVGSLRPVSGRSRCTKSEEPISS